MGPWIVRRLAPAVALGTVFAGCQTAAQNIPVMTVQQAENLPPSQRPTIFRDPDPLLAYPYDLHETDGLSRNPDDCMRWGCASGASLSRLRLGRRRLAL